MSKFLPLFDGLKLNSPLKTMSDDAGVENAKHIWENESLGGIAENNNPLPRPVVGLLLLTFITAMAWTFPLFGQRPSAAIYSDYIGIYKSDPVQRILNDTTLTSKEADERAMAMIEKALAEFPSKYEFQRTQHPITMSDLRIMEDKLIELQQTPGIDLEEYSIIGNEIVVANFEGNYKADGTREKKQPWWDKGYKTAIFWFLGFCLAVIITVKRLPPIDWKPDHSVAH
ncbi:hypothetical protein D8Y20_06380 [Mariprofundus sp. EBB-1]|uniref:cbb3-type cytochrome c oxidase N-terminal domain-containing protein n=1 Tax=Mariprofundus sp. EBB-1 TaxID=2650971 RepID=UPI000EF28E89|nr:cbb3-type cytochrome c oxidase N-terminal domain-containing protein [Mariprofundus sp. EBB-1]RLL52871.1 hypothetical protein D8Y20_06380 [Mariprofundus sp. EBB-1]